MDSFVPAEISLGVTHHLYPEYYLFGTEACSGWSPLDRGVKLGSWHRAEQYAHDIIEVRSSWLMHESYACSVRSTVTDMWFQGGSPPSMLPCRFTGCSLLHTLFLRNCPQAIRASWNWCFVSSVFTLSLSLKGNRTPSILSILHGSIQTLEEEFVYVDVLSLWHLNKTPGTSPMDSFKQNNNSHWKVTKHRLDNELWVFVSMAGLKSLCGGLDWLEPGVGPDWWTKLG